MTKEPEQHKLFISAILTLICLGLAIIWIPRFPAMQDYPQHLYMAYVLSEFNNPAFLWNQIYDVNWIWGPYNLFYLVVSSLYSIVPIEVAGKLFLSLSLFLTTTFIFSWYYFRSKENPPWSLLLLFPFFFSQIYYLGFTNYLISIPILFLLLLTHLILTEEKLKLFTIAIYFFLSSLLFLSHPYTILVYIVLSLTISLSCRNSLKTFVISIIPTLITIALFSIWLSFTFDNSLASTSDGLKIRWWPGLAMVEYFFLPFVGMNIASHINYINLILWLICAVLFALAYLNQRQEFNILHLRLFLLTLLGYVSLPFWLGDYSYFNLRMSIICYFSLAVLLSEIKLSQFSVYILIVSLCCVMAITFKNNQAISMETEELLPFIYKMKNNASVYSLNLDATPENIDKDYFYQFHVHTNFYCNIMKGGWGQNLFDSNMNPIKMKDIVSMPVFESKPEFYEYIIMRTGDSQKNYFFKKHKLLMESKHWKLYQLDLTLNQDVKGNSNSLSVGPI